MSAPSTTHTFVLRAVEYSDRDLIVTLFGRETGKFSAICKNARGSKRRFGGGLQPMRRLEAQYVEKPNRDIARLDEITVVDDYAAIQSDYDKITI
ncbi:MAG: DNA repair protein RecO, partial [Bradymonadaceae bacterium]